MSGHCAERKAVSYVFIYAGNDSTRWSVESKHTFSLSSFNVHRQQRMGSGGSGEVRSKMAVAATGPCCLDFDLDSLEEDVALGGSNAAARMNRLDSFKLRIRRGNAVDRASRRGPMVSVKIMTFFCMQNIVLSGMCKVLCLLKVHARCCGTCTCCFPKFLSRVDN
jgi:hypothetical protein